MGVLRHRGRRSGRSYQVPLMVFGGDPTWYIVLTYGPNRDWVKNLEAAGGGELIHRRRTVRVTNPRMADAAVALPHVAPFGRAWRKVTRAPEFYAVDSSD
jgi:deazaflavin-dependent oxidoreductase (nitroreductase family)